MVDRVLHSEDKKKCGLTFKFTLDVPFSVSMKEADADKFKFNVGQKNDDVSRVLREILLREVNINSKRDLDIFLAPATDLARELFYKKLGVSRTTPFSVVVEKSVLKFNKRQQKIIDEEVKLKEK